MNRHSSLSARKSSLWTQSFGILKTGCSTMTT
jgi:hypothetical protein